MKMPADAIREEIRKNGAISFARFMDLALYCPETGYYEAKEDRIGQGGDFITSVSVGNLFGELLAFQFAEWLAAENSSVRHTIVEAGAHDGRLAGDILAWLRDNRAKLFEHIEYVIVEPSLRRQAWQRETLKLFGSRVRWFSGFQTSMLGPVNGIIFSNELLDAFPVRRFGWDAARQEWFEWGVALEEGTPMHAARPSVGDFCWRRIQLSMAKGSGGDTTSGERPATGVCHAPSAIYDSPPSLLAVLPDGYVVETSPAAENCWREMAGALERGKLLTIDYGYGPGEVFSPGRTKGTLRAYRRHRISDDLLADPGEQDLTAHVNFAALQAAGESAGLRTELFGGQAQFLTRILQKAALEKPFAHLNAKQVRQFQTLTHPEHLGRAFRVLVQGR